MFDENAGETNDFGSGSVLTEQDDMHADQDFKPDAPVFISAIAKVPPANMVKEEDAVGNEGAGDGESSNAYEADVSINSSKDASTSWSDFNTPENRTEDLLRLYDQSKKKLTFD